MDIVWPRASGYSCHPSEKTLEAIIEKPGVQIENRNAKHSAQEPSHGAIALCAPRSALSFSSEAAATSPPLRLVDRESAK